METQWICLSNGGWRYDLKHSRRWSLWSHCSKVSLTVYHICEIKCLWNIWDAVNVILVMSLSSCGRLKSMSMWGSFSRFRVKIQKQSHRVALLLLVTAFCKPSNLLFFFLFELQWNLIWLNSVIWKTMHLIIKRIVCDPLLFPVPLCVHNREFSSLPPIYKKKFNLSVPFICLSLSCTYTHVHSHAPICTIVSWKGRRQNDGLSSTFYFVSM